MKTQKLTENMARTLLTAVIKGGVDETGSRGVKAAEALEARGLVKITKRFRTLVNCVIIEVTDAGLEAAVQLEDLDVKPYGQPGRWEKRGATVTVKLEVAA